MKKAALLLTCSSSLLLSGCLGTLTEFFCEMESVGDSDHCYQSAAVQQSEPEKCQKVEGEGFTGQNPPKDKCYLQIAENTGDPSVCDSIEGGITSYSKEECLENVFRTHGPESCKDARNPDACRNTYASNGKGCGEGYTYVNGTCKTAKESSGSASSEDTSAFTEAAVGDVNTMAEAAKGKYMELLEADIAGETDPDRLAGLQAYKEFLDKAGETMEDAQTKLETLNELKKIFVDSYDPSNDIEHMSVNALLGPGLWDRVNERLFGPDAPKEGLEKENDQAENALTVYEAMLKRQEENDFLKKGKLERLGDTVASKFKDEVTGKVTEGAKEIAEGLAGTAFGAVTSVGEALQAFQDEAQKQMFLGLARAYNRRREALTQQNPGLSPEELHKRTVEQVQDDPYQDNTQLAVVKHGNLLQNKDCQDEGNPLCIDNRVWWTAMDKTYKYTHK